MNTKPKSKAVCHPDRNLSAHGLCQQCWGKNYRQQHKLYYRIKSRETQREQRKQVIEKLGGRCVKCGFSDHRALQVDHVHGGGSKDYQATRSRYAFHLKVLNDTEGLYQLLCANCNWIKRTENEEVKIKSDLNLTNVDA